MNKSIVNIFYFNTTVRKSLKVQRFIWARWKMIKIRKETNLYTLHYVHIRLVTTKHWECLKEDDRGQYWPWVRTTQTKEDTKYEQINSWWVKETLKYVLIKIRTQGTWPLLRLDEDDQRTTRWSETRCV